MGLKGIIGFPLSVDLCALLYVGRSLMPGAARGDPVRCLTLADWTCHHRYRSSCIILATQLDHGIEGISNLGACQLWLGEC